MIKKFIQYYKPHKVLFLTDLLVAFLIAGIDLVFPMYSRTIINDLIPNNNLRGIILYSSIVIILYIVKVGGNYFVGYWGHLVGARMEFDMRRDLFKHLQTLEFAFYDNNKTGQLMNRLMGDLNEISELAHHGPEDLFISLIMLVGSFFLLIQINMTLTLIVFVFVLLAIFFSVHMRKSMMKTFRAVRSKQADINAQLESSISGIRLAKSFANEHFEDDKFSRTNRAHYHSKKASFRAIAMYTAGNNFFIDMMTLSSMMAGGIFVYYGQINYGDLVAFLLFISFFTKPIRSLIQLTQQFQSGMTGFERFSELMAIEPKIKDAEDAKPLQSVKGDIEFKNVTFSYEPGDPPVLNDFNLSIESGKTIALVGPSGVGKTTISQLIPRFYDIGTGSIAIDGQDIKHLTLSSLRENIGIVQQEVFLFFGTIGENIAYGRPDATLEEIAEAAKKANIHEFIRTLDHGYDTMVGERGIKLSGGQKQRIAIARVFLKNPAVLILDEATSALDNENEFAIQQAIEVLAKDRTTLIIAHRLSTIKNADEILVMGESGILERGTHEMLIQKNGIYNRLYRAQFRGYIPDQLING
ncbi:MAG: ATP-binding cassette, subfamily bacterial [Clostridiales bacterium]|nr:ATP-binding cassette, subfamily bacterial [Clostridiales bacterium]